MPSKPNETRYEDLHYVDATTGEILETVVMAVEYYWDEKTQSYHLLRYIQADKR